MLVRFFLHSSSPWLSLLVLAGLPVVRRVEQPAGRSLPVPGEGAST
jgi:hypothetical protein